MGHCLSRQTAARVRSTFRHFRHARSGAAAVIGSTNLERYIPIGLDANGAGLRGAFEVEYTEPRFAFASNTESGSDATRRSDRG